MRTQSLLCVMLLGWVLSACNGTSAEIDHTRLPPERDALAHFCRHMAKGPSATTMALPAIQRQGAWFAEMTDAATVANIQSWPSFRSSILGIGPDGKQAWLEVGVRVHGLQSECAVILKK